ncbi:glycosyltransferase family 8 protein [Segatella bryantii]|uniref:glycosyltransferase family 8 protein n=1 Tax=Segatella bryantii TaxID=77095 RepID=UPI001EDBF9BA|nr:glycosyltransferase family 8 protein [Segatella bryantii]UKK74840.1 glycosyltransferase family 8 protein [Segatella bryantii]
MINILLSTDDNYVMPTGVLMTSICENTKSEVTFYIMTNADFKDESRSSLKRNIAKYNQNIVFIPVQPSATKDFPFGRPDQPTHVSVATYYRLLITNLLPKNVDKIIYLDGDMIVMDDIADYFNEDVDGYAVGAVIDQDMDENVKDERLEYPKQDGYFNAGSLLINLKYWREHHAYEEFIKVMHEKSNIIIFHDQDVLNYVFHDKKKWLSPRYNIQTEFLVAKKVARYGKELIKAIKNPLAIHFCMRGSKPWMIRCDNPFTEVWRKYKSISVWANSPLQNNVSGNLKNRIRMFLVKYHLWKETYYLTIPKIEEL